MITMPLPRPRDVMTGDGRWYLGMTASLDIAGDPRDPMQPRVVRELARLRISAGGLRDLLAEARAAQAEEVTTLLLSATANLAVDACPLHPWSTP